jgi:hypothetical protein
MHARSKHTHSHTHNTCTQHTYLSLASTAAPPAAGGAFAGSDCAASAFACICVLSDLICVGCLPSVCAAGCTVSACDGSNASVVCLKQRDNDCTCLCFVCVCVCVCMSLCALLWLMFVQVNVLGVECAPKSGTSDDAGAKVAASLPFCRGSLHPTLYGTLLTGHIHIPDASLPTMT